MQVAFLLTTNDRLSTMKMRVGVLGAARIAAKNARAIADSGEAEIVAVGSRSLDKARKFCIDNGLDESCAVEGYDACIEKLASGAGEACMYVPLPTTMHLEWVKKLAARGLHILLEKPAAINVAELDEMIRVCRDAGVVLMDGVMFMHHPRLNVLSEVLSVNPPIAEISSEWSFLGSEDFMKNDIRVKKEGDPLGCLGDLGWYNIRYSLFFANYAMPSRVEGEVVARSSSGVPIDFKGKLYWDKQGITDSFACSFVRPRDGSGVTVRGEGFSVALGPDFVVPVETQNPKHASFKVSSGSFIETRSFELYDTQECYMIKRMVREIRSGTKSSRTFWLDVMRKTQVIVNALLESAGNGGRPVCIEEARRPQFTIFYFDGFNGRAEPALLMLEDSGVEYERKDRAELQKITNASFGVPALMDHNDGTIFGQTTAQCEWLASKLGYAPLAHRRFLANKIAGDVADMWSEGYSMRKALMQGKSSKAECIEWLAAAPDGSRNAGRFARLLTAIESTRREAMDREGVKSWTYIIGDRPTFVDFLALNAMRAIEFCYGEAAAKGASNAQAEGFLSSVRTMTQRPRIAAWTKQALPVIYESVSAAAAGGFI